MVNYVVISADAFGRVFGPIYACATTKCKNVTFQIERMILNFDEHNGSLEVDALLSN